METGSTTDLPERPSVQKQAGTRGPLKLIRRFCLDCTDGPKSVRFCTAVDCPLWIYRFGKRPKRVIREYGKEAAELFDRKWILEQCERDRRSDAGEEGTGVQ